MWQTSRVSRGGDRVNEQARGSRPVEIAAVRENLERIGVIKPVVVEDGERAVLDLPDFPDTEDGRRAFVEAMRALGK